MDQDFAVIALKMLVALSVVLATFWGLLLLVRRFSNNPLSSSRAAKNMKPIEILAYQSLGPNKGMYLVRCCEQKILVGVTNANIQLITNIEQDETDGEQNSFASNLRDKLPEAQTKSLKQQLSEKMSDISRV